MTKISAHDILIFHSFILLITSDIALGFSRQSNGITYRKRRSEKLRNRASARGFRAASCIEHASVIETVRMASGMLGYGGKKMHESYPGSLVMVERAEMRPRCVHV